MPKFICEQAMAKPIVYGPYSGASISSPKK